MHKGELTNVNPPRITTEPSLESTQKNERKAQRKNINAMTSNIHCFFPHYNK